MGRCEIRSGVRKLKLAPQSHFSERPGLPLKHGQDLGEWTKKRKLLALHAGDLSFAFWFLAFDF